MITLSFNDIDKFYTKPKIKHFFFMPAALNLGSVQMKTILRLLFFTGVLGKNNHKNTIKFMSVSVFTVSWL
ncbi:hypothetical protein B6J67_20535 [Klebsiella quasipneumoniae]|nr:hypothetical protein B6I87_05020 [Klebsiella quasipneumoniae]PLJ40283.1 hypothetical protein B6J67_20535 [Klebsiella quasipneumoniae]PLJ55992.1 hypothetical protein B6J68_28075 [Klebsiella quasipneumoniae]